MGGWGRVSLYETVGRRISKIALILGSPMDPIGILATHGCMAASWARCQQCEIDKVVYPFCLELRPLKI